MRHQKKILLAANCRVEKVVIDAIEKITNESLHLDYIDSIDQNGINFLRRHFSDFLVACRTLYFCKNYEKIIFWQQFIGIYYILLSKFFFYRNLPPAIILTFIFIERKGLLGKIHKWLVRQVVSAKSIKYIICHSSTEKKYYSEQFDHSSAHKFLFMPVGTGVGKNKFEIEDRGYFFSGGKSNRDYKVLFEAFAKVKERIIVACQPYDIAGLAVPSNVKIVHGAYGDDFIRLMACSKAVVITLKDPNVSAGQLVLLDAMRVEKMAIVNKGNCMDDYADDQFTIKIRANDVSDLVKAVRLVSNGKYNTKKMGIKAMETYYSYYTFEKYGERLGNVILSIN
jgi:glycosyltransferase involved in cell wall biosynthesis